MIIKSSNLNMDATHRYASKMKTKEEYRVKNPFESLYSSTEQSMSQDLFEKNSNSNQGKSESKKTDSETNQNDLLKPLTSKRAQQMERMRSSFEKFSIRRQILTQLLRALFSDNKTLFEQIEQSINQEDIDWSDGLSGSETYKYEEYFYEKEQTCVSTTGKAVTADGREIEFDVEINMSRTFEGYFQAGMTTWTDPLVINVGSSVTEIGKQTFSFDIDADGELDKISTLGKGSGFLAFDQNEDGIINDGSELFGALTGDGFADLAKYDMDHNGWIDEADEIFGKLKVWFVDDSGQQKLISLKEAGVGAIALQNVSSEFTKTDNANNANAYIRKTGMFLYEDGMAGTIQHVDFVKKGA